MYAFIKSTKNSYLMKYKLHNNFQSLTLGTFTYPTDFHMPTPLAFCGSSEYSQTGSSGLSLFSKKFKSIFQVLTLEVTPQKFL